MLIIVNYHYVRDRYAETPAGIVGVTPAALAAQLRLLGTQGTFVSGADVRDAWRRGKRLPPRALLVTFDDGLREQYECALPMLRQLGIPAIFFVNTGPLANGTVSAVHKLHLLLSAIPVTQLSGFVESQARAVGIRWGGNHYRQRATTHYRYDVPAVACIKYFLNIVLPPRQRDALLDASFRAAAERDERDLSRELYMTVGQVRTLAREGLIGTHGHEHSPLAGIPLAQAKENLRLSVEHLTAWTGGAPFAVSYPYGGPEMYSVAVSRAARRLGLELGFTMEARPVSNLKQPHRLPRFDTNDLPGGRMPTIRIEELFLPVDRRSGSAVGDSHDLAADSVSYR